MAYGKFDSPMEDADLGLPTEDTSDRHTLDQVIRKRGYTVLNRPKRGETVWEKAGIPFTQSDVIFREGLQEFQP